MKANTLDEVIARLEEIVESTHSTADPLGIFALVYLGVTLAVKQDVQNNLFQDGARMERLDIIFANRYLEAYEAYRQGIACTQAWHTSFEAAKRFDLLVLQHLLMGMNAHINLDLGIAAAETMPAHEIRHLEADFNRINQLLTANINAIQDKLSAVSPLLFLVDWFGKDKDERFAAFGLVASRTGAWQAANRLALLSDNDKLLEINELDAYVTLLNKVISKPGIFFGRLVRFIKWFEVKDVRRVLNALR